MNISNNFSININRDEFPVYFPKIRKYSVYTHIYTYIHYIFCFFNLFTLEMHLFIFYSFTQITQKTQHIYILTNNVLLGKNTKNTKVFKSCFSLTPYSLLGTTKSEI